MRNFLLILILAFGLLAGCSSSGQKDPSVSFYYPRSQIRFDSEDGAFSSEEQQSSGLTNEEILDLYLSGPEISSLSQPFPANCKTVSLQIQDNSTSVVLSDEYASLSGLELAIANACLAQTVMELTGTDTVVLSCGSQLLNGEAYITVTKDSLIIYDNSVGVASGSTEATADPK